MVESEVVSHDRNQAPRCGIISSSVSIRTPSADSVCDPLPADARLWVARQALRDRHVGFLDRGLHDHVAKANVTDAVGYRIHSLGVLPNRRRDVPTRTTIGPMKACG